MKEKIAVLLLGVTLLTGAVPSDAGVQGVRGDIKNAFYAGQDRFLVAADGLYLYDVDGGVKEQGELELEYISHAGPAGEGYVLVGARQERSWSFVCDFYDRSLRRTKSLALNELAGETMAVLDGGAVAVSPDGGSVAWSGSGGLYLYDVASASKRRLLEGGNPQANRGIIGLDQIAFTNGGKHIAFLADVFALPIREGVSSHKEAGLIGTDGTGLVSRTPAGFDLYELQGAYGSYALYAESFARTTGRFLRMEVPGGNAQPVALSGTTDNKKIYGSDGGKYVSTCFLSGTDWVVQICDAQTGALVSQQRVASGGEIYRYRDPVVRVLDGKRSCLILLGHSQDEARTRAVIRSF